MADHARDASIPLRCCICPKRPKFSDLSHLLTHVASKGHLAQQFKTSVRAPTDENAKDALDRYNDWFQRYGIEQLCANRLRSNEFRKSRAATSGASLSSRPSAQRPPSAATNANSQNRWASAGSANHAPLRSVSAAGEAIPFAVPPGTPAPWAEQRSAQKPQIAIWSTDSARLHQAPRLVEDSPSYAPSPYSSVAGTNSDQATVDETPAYPAEANAAYPLESLIESSTPATTDDRNDETSDEADKPEAESLLKGVLWPGMDIFDSAPPEMKRKRNQKKDGSVVAQMQLNSTLVEPTELIFWAGGDFKKERRIYSAAELGETENNRPTSSRAPNRKRASPVAGMPLRELDANVQRRRPAQPLVEKSSNASSPQASRAPLRPLSTNTSSNKVAKPNTARNDVGHPPLPTVTQKPSVKRRAASPNKEKKKKKKRLAAPVIQAPQPIAPLKHSAPLSSPTESAPLGLYHSLATLTSSMAEPLPASSTDGAVLGSSQQEVMSDFKPVDIHHPSGKDTFDIGHAYPEAFNPLMDRHFYRRRVLDQFADAEPFSPHFFDPQHSVDFDSLADVSAFGYSANPLGLNYQISHGFQFPLLADETPESASALSLGTGADMSGPPLLPFKARADCGAENDFFVRQPGG
jgi:hypothetical protein